MPVTPPKCKLVTQVINNTTRFFCVKELPDLTGAHPQQVLLVLSKPVMVEVDAAACKSCKYNQPSAHVEVVQPPPPVPTTKIEMRRDGTVVLPKTSWEPPPCPEGYNRVSNNPTSEDAWHFKSQWEKCQHRGHKILKHEGCNCTKLIPICTLDQSELTLEICVTCTKRTVQ
jgi:hypothetical protein